MRESSKPSVVRGDRVEPLAGRGCRLGASVTSRHSPGWPPRPTRPRSWCSWETPNRSASRITITVALGTSTPTSMTVVATSTSTSPAAKRRITRVLLVGRHPAVQHLDAQPGQRPVGAARRATSSTAAAAGRAPRVAVLVEVAPVGLALVRLVVADPRADDVGLVAARRPPRGPAAQARSSQCGLVRQRARRWSAIGARPAGSSVSVEVSRSPKTVIATVRGIGVAVITSTCGGAAGLAGQRGALLDAEAVLLVDDDQAEVGELRPCSSSSAWVPMTMPASPLASRRAAAGGARGRGHASR